MNRRSRVLGPVLAAVAMVAAFSGPASALESAWDAGHRSRTRLIAAEAATGATRLAGIEIEMAPDHKTYWRTPGDAGLPPEFDWSRSRNVAAVVVDWPAPVRFEDGGGTAYGYRDHVVLPVRVTSADPTRPLTLALDLSYGVCKEICVPARAGLTLELPPAGQPSPAAGSPGDEALRAARARVPVPQPAGAPEPLSILSAAPEAGGEALRVEIRAPAESQPRLFAEGPQGWYLAADEAMEPGGGGNGRFRVEIAERPRDASGIVPLRFTLVAGDRAVESLVPVAAESLDTR